jgi:glycosyltransferase involved in cell wall biosynthesis
VAVLFHRLGPYHFARLRAAGRLFPIVAIESSGVDQTYAWDLVAGADQFERVTLFEQGDAQKLPAAAVVDRVVFALDKTRPGVVVIAGWTDSAALGALQWSIKNHSRDIIMSESTEWDERRVFWKEWVKEKLLSLCSSALVGGSPHSDYIVKLGMQADRVFLGYDAVDNEYFAAEAAKWRERKAESKKKFGLPERYFLASARFVEKKNLPRLIRAYALYRKKSEPGNQKAEGGNQKSDLRPPTFDPWSLVLLGDWPLKSDLRSLITDLSLQDSVLLPGFKQYNELPAYYAFAGAFVHASTTEQWGLVVNEAMASGLPVLVSNRCGCARDLVREGKNGFTFDPCNIDQLAELMLKISALNFPLSALGNASRQIISNWSPDRFAQGLKDAVDMALKSPPPKAGLMDRLLLRLLLLR